jgi:hypothetical protein|tara:strand:- start:23644 stop:24267 length:624 start_codon:yes stop_codon:yes gene_type:complete
MALVNYSDLKTSIADWLNRSDLTATIPDFITLAESGFNKEIRNRKMIKRATATIDSQYSAVPADWLQTVDFVIEANPVVTLEFITNEKLDKLRETYTSSGTPKFYTIVGQELEVLPVPDSATLTGEITYYSKIPNLTDVNPTNWLMNSSPDIYLYGSLLQSAPYLVDDSRIPVWASMYQKLVKDLEIADQKARVGDSTLKMKATALQ